MDPFLPKTNSEFLSQLSSLQPLDNKRLLCRTDPARLISLFNFYNHFNELYRSGQCNNLRHVAVVSGFDEPELSFLPPHVKVDHLNYEDNPQLWDLTLDWSDSKYSTYQEKYDIVFCEQVLEHLPTPQLAVRNLVKICRPSGYVHVSVPCINGIHGDPYYYFAGFHPRLLLRWISLLDCNIISCGTWGSKKLAQMYSICDWSPLCYSGGLSLFLYSLKYFCFDRHSFFGLKHLFRFIRNSILYPFKSLWNCSEKHPVITWIYFQKKS